MKYRFCVIVLIICTLLLNGCTRKELTVCSLYDLGDSEGNVHRDYVSLCLDRQWMGEWINPNAKDIKTITIRKKELNLTYSYSDIYKGACIDAYLCDEYPGITILAPYNDSDISFFVINNEMETINTDDILFSVGIGKIDEENLKNFCSMYIDDFNYDLENHIYSVETSYISSSDEFKIVDGFYFPLKDNEEALSFIFDWKENINGISTGDHIRFVYEYINGAFVLKLMIVVNLISKADDLLGLDDKLIEKRITKIIGYDGEEGCKIIDKYIKSEVFDGEVIKELWVVVKQNSNNDDRMIFTFTYDGKKIEEIVEKWRMCKTSA